MTYNFETYYSHGDIDIFTVLKVTATYLADFCTDYDAGILAARKGYQGKTQRCGLLPKDKQARANLIDELVTWLKDSCSPQLFEFFLINQKGEKILDHHDDDCCWSLELSKEQFSGLQQQFLTNKLPADLFYDHNAGVCINATGLAGWFGFKKCFTPKEYQQYQINKKKLSSS